MTDGRDVGRQIESIFQGAGLEGFLHAVNIDTGRSVGYREQTLCLSASVGKVPILVSLMRAVDQGEFNLDTRMRVPVEGRTPGPTGLSVLPDEAELSLRGVAQLMIAVSDNHATDMVLDLLTPERVTDTMSALGFSRTAIRGYIRDLYEREGALLQGIESYEQAVELLRTDPDLDPASGAWVTTPEEITRLFTLIWREEAASPPLCGTMRQFLRTCATHNGLVTGFPMPAQERIAHKTGTLAGVRNDAGVVEYPDGGRYAVAVFTRIDLGRWKAQDAETSAAIGRAAFTAVEHIRLGETQAQPTF